MAPPRTPPKPNQQIVIPDNALLVGMTQKYGKTRYWAENETSELFINLLKQDAFSEQNTIDIKKLGYRIFVKEPGKAVYEL